MKYRVKILGYTHGLFYPFPCVELMLGKCLNESAITFEKPDKIWINIFYLKWSLRFSFKFR